MLNLVFGAIPFHPSSDQPTYRASRFAPVKKIRKNTEVQKNVNKIWNFKIWSLDFYIVLDFIDMLYYSGVIISNSTKGIY